MSTPWYSQFGKTVFAFVAEWLPAPISSRRNGLLPKALFKKLNLVMKEEDNALKFMRKDKYTGLSKNIPQIQYANNQLSCQPEPACPVGRLVEGGLLNKNTGFDKLNLTLLNFKGITS
jgi:hypothetical protein